MLKAFKNKVLHQDVHKKYLTNTQYQYLITLFAVLNKSFIFSLHKIKYLTKINLERKITY